MTDAGFMPADQDVRDRGLDVTTSFIVQAPAGSGKTELLVQRYLALLAHVQRPEQILAMTFTRKATGEMRARILAALHLATTAEAPEEPHRKKTWTLARAVVDRDAEQGWNLQAQPNRLRIVTLDGLNAMLAGRMPLLSGAGATLTVADDPRRLYLEAARRTVAGLSANDEPGRALADLVTHLDNRIDKLVTLLSEMLEQRDHWMRLVVGRLSEPELRQTLEKTLTGLVETTLKEALDAVPLGCRDEIDTLARFAGERLRTLDPGSPLSVLDGLPSPDTQHLQAWRALARLFLTQGNQWRKRVDKRDGFDPDSKPAKDRMLALLASLDDADDLRQSLGFVKDLPEGVYSESQWSALRALCVVLPQAVAELSVLTAETGETDYVGVAQTARVALGDADAPTDLALYLDYALQHILVDEFQDTSHGQYEILRCLTAGWEPDDGRTLFCVGDPMQSIYRFREAEVGLFLQSRRRGIGDVALEPLTLTVNFRSRKAVVDWVNESFARVFPEREDPFRGSVPFATSLSHRGDTDGSGVTVIPQPARDDIEEANRVVELLRDAGAAGGDTAILVRSRPHLAEIVLALGRAGISYSAVEIQKLGNRPIVRDLVSLTRALQHPGERTAWLAVLRAPWCGLSLDDLLILAGERPDRTIWEALNDPATVAGLSEDARVRLQRVRAALGPVLDNRGRQNARQWLDGAWLSLGGPASVGDRRELKHAEAFFGILERLETVGVLHDFDTLDAAVDELYAAAEPGTRETVQVMTIHKAKGLEFDTVIVPGLGRSPRSDTSRLLRWLELPTGGDRPDELILAPIAAQEDSADLLYRYLARLDRRRNLEEENRLLYVAATRARERLVLIGHVKVKEQEGREREIVPDERSLLKRLWPAVETSFTHALQDVSRDTRVAEDRPDYRPTRLDRLSGAWVLPAPPDSVPVKPEPTPVDTAAPVHYDWAGESARIVGVVVHGQLQRIAEDGPDHWTEERLAAEKNHYASLLRGLGHPEADLDATVGRVHRALAATLGDTRGRWLLRPTHESSHCEHRLTGVDAGRIVNIVIDRTFVDETGTRWIVDYKTGLHEGGDLDAFLDNEQRRYKPQLERYARVLRVTESRPTKLALYFPLLQRWREWAPATE